MDYGIPNDVLVLLKELKRHIETTTHALNVLEEEKMRVWSCPSWMFPQEARHKFEPVPQASASSSSTSFAPNTFVGAPLVIANSPLAAHMGDLWEASGPRLCADGGANRLFSWSKLPPQDKKEHFYLPYAIIGDLDSIRPEVMYYYRDHVRFSFHCGSRPS